MTTITVSVTGAEPYLARLAAGRGIGSRVRATVRRLGYTLERKVKLEKLNGQVLNRRTGRLARSVNTRFISSTNEEIARVGTNVVYGRAWELGASIPAYTILPKTKQALAWPGARHPVKAVHMPARQLVARPFLKPALAELRPEIERQLSEAIRGESASPSGGE